MAAKDNQGIPEPSAASGSSDSSNGETPLTLSSEGGGVMVFQAGVGEVPNVLQYLNFSRRTGKLEVDSKQMLAERGVICFRDGEVYYARLGPVRGLEAIVDMVGFKSAEAVFFDGDHVGAANIDIPTKDLILRVAVAADKKAAEASTGLASEEDDDFLVPAKFGSRVILRQTAVQTEVEPQSRDVAGKLAVVMIILAAVAVIVNTIWVVSELKDASVRRRAQREADAVRQEQARVEEERRLAINATLQRAVEAYTANRLDEGGEAVAEVLGLDPANEGALNLLRRIEEANSLVDLVPLRAQASVREQQLNALKELTPLTMEADAAHRILHNANAHYDEKHYREAVTQYRQFIAATDALSARKSDYDLAMASRNQSGRLRRRAEEAGAGEFAPEAFKQGQQLDTRGEEEFAARSFGAAGKAWREAARLYGRAGDQALERAELVAAQSRFEDLLGQMDESVLAEYAADGWLAVQRVEKDARQRAANGALSDAADKWHEAAGMLPVLWAQASSLRNEAVFARHMAEAEAAAERQDWAAAVDALTIVMALETFAQQPRVTQLWRQVRHANLKTESEQLQDQKNWQDLRRAAMEMLELRPDDAEAKRMLLAAETMLLPRIHFTLTAAGEDFERGEITVIGEEAIREDLLVFRLQPGGQYTFVIKVPQREDVYYAPVRFNYVASKSGTQAVRIEMREVGAPTLGQEWTNPVMDMDLVPVPAGSFRMGSTLRGEEKPVRTIRFSKPFWMASTETTNAQYRRFLAQAEYDGRQDARSSYLKHFTGQTDVPAGDDFPVCYISWMNASAFCHWLTAHERQGQRLPKGYVYRLPTEAEWEYCCKAGQDRISATVSVKMAWHGNRSANNERVATLKPNGWKIYDMQGNVWEFCYDWYGPYPEGAATDPAGPDSGYFRVLRGGSWRDSIDQCRPSYRSQIAVTEARNNIGFRVVLAPPIP